MCEFASVLLLHINKYLSGQKPAQSKSEGLWFELNKPR